MLNKLGSFLAVALGMVLLIYSASRSYDFVAMTLPADRQPLAYFALAALDGGLVAWLLCYLYGSSGGWQRMISLVMVVIDFLGSALLFTADTLFNTGKSGLTGQLTEQQIFLVVVALSVIIAANIAATVAHHIVDPDNLRAQAEEEARGIIDDMALKMIRDNAQALAAQVAPRIADHWRSETDAEYTGKLKRGKPLTPKVNEITDVPLLDDTANPTKPRRGQK